MKEPLPMNEGKQAGVSVQSMCVYVVYTYHVYMFVDSLLKLRCSIRRRLHGRGLQPLSAGVAGRLAMEGMKWARAGTWR